jgi:hypothetical protein
MSIDRQRLLIGGSLVLMLLGAVLLCFTHGGVFNPVVPYSYRVPGNPLSQITYHRDAAQIDLTKEGPLVGVLALLLGAGGVVYGYASRPPAPDAAERKEQT